MSDQNETTNKTTKDDAAEEIIGFADDVTEKKAETTPDDSEDLAVIPNSAGLAMSAMEIESMIHRNLAEIDKLRDQVKTQKEMYDSTIENDAAYAEQAEKEKEVKKATYAIKQKLTKQLSVMEITEKMKDLKEEMKDVQDTISGLAEEYERVSGTNQIMKENGEVLEIVKIYKLQKRKKEE